MPKETKRGGKRIPHPKGYIDKGLLYKGQVYPLFSDKQSGQSWTITNSIKSKNIKKKDLDRLKASLKEATNDREREEAYISFYKEKGIGVEVTEKVLQLANNRESKKFIKGSTDEFQDFNKVVRGKASIKVDKGNQKTAPKVEEVSGQGIPKEKVVKPTKIEQPDNMDEYLQMLNENKVLTKEDVDKIKNDGLTSYLGGLLDNVADATGLKVGVKKLINTFGNTAMLGKSLIELNNLIRGRRARFRMQDVIPINMWNIYYQAFSDLKEQKKLPLIKDKEKKEAILLDVNLDKEVEAYLQDVKKLGLNTADVDGGVRGNTLKGLYKKHFLGVSDEKVATKLIEKQKQRTLKDEAMKEAIEDTPQEPKGERESFGSGDPSKPNIRMEINETIPPSSPPSPKAKQGETSDEVTEQIKQRLMEQEGTAGYSPTTDDATGLDMDREEDTGIHNEAIQRIATMNDYDFSFTKKSLLSVKQLPNDKNELRKMGEKCLRQYGFLLGILEPKDNFSKEEVEEIETLTHILKQVIRLEAQYKRSLLKMRVSVSDGSNQLDKLMSEGQLGLVLNAGSLNISPQQAVEQSSTSPILPSNVEPQEPKQGIDMKEKPQKPEIDIFEEMGLKKKGKNKKKKKKGRLNMEYRDRRKAMFKEPRNIVFKGRINPPPQFQNLRSEAERLNENPVPLIFKSNTNMNRMRRFNVNY